MFVGFGECVIISLNKIELICRFLNKELLLRYNEEKLFIRVSLDLNKF